MSETSVSNNSSSINVDGSTVLSIIIVNWNSNKFLLELLHSITKFPPDCNYETIVIDNASFDGSNTSANNFEFTNFIQLPHNIGFSAANNIAVKHAKGKLLLFLNPDTLVHPNSIHELLKAHAVATQPGIIGAQLLNSNGTLQSSAVQSFPTVIGEFLDSNLLRRMFPKLSLWGNSCLYRSSPTCTEVDAVSGACMLIEKSAFQNAGEFPTRYFMYVEDIDLCKAVQALGLRNYYCSQSKITHHGGGSSRLITGFAARTRVDSLHRYFLHYHSYPIAYVFRLTILLKSIIRLGLLFPGTLNSSPSSPKRLQFNKWKSLLEWSVSS